jgi:Late exocytosis, associated with Golgi transport
MVIQTCPLVPHQLVSLHRVLYSPRLTSFPSDKFEGPWFTTQLLLSSFIGLTSFLLFSYCRKRWPLLYAPRTKLKGPVAVPQKRVFN